MEQEIQLRKGTATEWTSANPVLLSAEPGVEINTGKMKLGDGVSAWSDLPYAFVPPTAASLASNPLFTNGFAPLPVVDGSGLLTLTQSCWGLTAGGVAYYDANGVIAADRALIQFDPTTDAPLLIRIGV